ncbi:hypothetical protein [Agromyces sp. GXS1127]|uniref:hypothetical protein n=1 Tax=Agromyces sp. GXS1127 TaxID=3424181 RepID=UPI003D31AB6F
MTDISNGFLDPGDNTDSDRDELPMTQVDDEAVQAHLDDDETGTDVPEGQGSGIGGETTRLPEDDRR